MSKVTRLIGSIKVKTKEAFAVKPVALLLSFAIVGIALNISSTLTAMESSKEKPSHKWSLSAEKEAIDAEYALQMKQVIADKEAKLANDFSNKIVANNTKSKAVAVSATNQTPELLAMSASDRQAWIDALPDEMKPLNDAQRTDYVKSRSWSADEMDAFRAYGYAGK